LTSAYVIRNLSSDVQHTTIYYLLTYIQYPVGTMNNGQ